MHLHAPNLLALAYARHLEQDVRAYPPLECRVEIRRQVGRENHHTGEALELLQQHVDDGVGFANEAHDPSDADRRDAIASASSNSSTAFSFRARRKVATMFFGVSPIHIDSTSA